MRSLSSISFSEIIYEYGMLNFLYYSSYDIINVFNPLEIYLYSYASSINFISKTSSSSSPAFYFTSCFICMLF